MPVTTRSEGNRLEIRIDGRFDFTAHRDFRNSYRNSGAGTEYVVNLSGVEYLDSSALGMLLLLREYAGGDKARITLTNCQETVIKILKIANFDRLFSMA